ncbi:hypothetical protein WICANDRAFT_83004 [Wickerhamomyces anomalus NRRL Y-366-8]|uniref:Cytidine deaminase n=1 Tax=Wickerhamomyces anomalus (strain ATCC 58044 / CBS 1984 / NCYC 433 / NRRL Y-366-8) TaxID=683960 RepID=A0A1E3P5X2_WICAA|nr:uncharacterized protein WICANDRAFT_83004 [Wickerhamomyces anomalus NRRL Y-366-8]ODQ60644.1 hypothetical protein WICANDRAFT_83004 [Wickerhamomyces anomalus NRRL Y-366-8]
MPPAIQHDHKGLTRQEFEELKTKALEARDLSYSPYSKFRVGCCILTNSGKYFQGANVENASYGASICAERTTICSAIIQKEKSFKAIGISSDLEEVITPCGICRQFIREFGKTIPIYMFKSNGDFIKMSLEEILPLSFGPEQLS